MNSNDANNHQILIVLRRIRHIIGESCRSFESTNNFDRPNLINCLRNLERIRNDLSDETYISLSNAITGLLTLPVHDVTNLSYTAERAQTGEIGRPAVKITRDQLLFLFNEGYTIKSMAKNFNCSVSTVSKGLYAEGISMRSRYTNITDDEIRSKIEDIHKSHPNCGSEMMVGYLKAQGIFVQRYKIRQFLNEIDPLGAAQRWSRSIKRRQYNVPTPNSLWHMDAHCKLSRWGLIIHGCIDGYSRLIVYLSCITSIQAKPVLNLFVEATTKYGIPSRVRSDHGYENLYVAFLMNLLRGLQRGSHITGKSVHNQRIERLWIDVYKEVVDVVYNELYELEDANLLDPDNNVHRYCCQFIYLPIVNNKLCSFVDAWNFHKMRTAQRRTPRQIWVDGMVNKINGNYTATNEVFNDQNNLLMRLRESLLTFDNFSNIINIETPRDSLYTAVLNLSDEKIIELNVISARNITSKEKYVMCVESITNSSIN